MMIRLLVGAIMGVGLLLAAAGTASPGGDALTPALSRGERGMGAATQPKGPPLAVEQVHKNIVCRTDKEYHCEVFVPRGYRSDQPAPILYVFSPNKNASTDLFKATADKLGWIVCASVESENGHTMPFYEKIFAAMRDEMNARFNLHPHRTYFTGLSGGARVALSLFGGNTNSAAGVIAMSAGQLLQMDKVPGGAVVGTSGYKDFNYLELVALADRCTQADLAYLFLDFQGGHEWAPRNLVSQAMEWLEVQYFIRSPHLTVAEKTKRPGVINDVLKRVGQLGATMLAYETCEQLQRDLAAAAVAPPFGAVPDETPGRSPVPRSPATAPAAKGESGGGGDAAALKKVDALLAELKPKLTKELEAREALREAFAAAAKKPTSYQAVLAIQASAKDLAGKYPGTVYGQRAGALAESLDDRLQRFPPEARK